jgi:RNA polymerase sigma-70 factor (ECF subfamily)
VSIDEEFISEKLIFRPDISDIDDKKDIALIMSSLEQLKDIERDVIIMRFVEDWPIKEVSEAVNKSEGAVKLIQHRAIGKIRELLKNNE